MKERWKKIPGYNGFYEVSDRGRVRSWYGKNGVKRKTPKVLSINNSKGDYLSVNLYKSVPQTVKKPTRVHVLVAKTFVSGWFKGAIVHHEDENKQNNRADNLEWVTYRKNLSISRKRRLPTGVYKKKKNKGYETSIMFEGKTWPLGYYKTKNKASKVYQQAVKLIEKSSFDPVEYKKELDLEKAKKRKTPIGVSKRNHGFEVSIKFKKNYYYLGSYDNLNNASTISKCARKLVKLGRFKPKEFRQKVGLE